MAYKNPWITAILNFFVPGVGFIYLGQRKYLIIGIILIFITFIYTATFYSASSITFFTESIWDVLWAIIGYLVAIKINKENQ